MRLKSLSFAKRFANREIPLCRAPAAPFLPTENTKKQAAPPCPFTEQTARERRSFFPANLAATKAKPNSSVSCARCVPNGGAAPDRPAPTDITIAELVLKFMAHAESYYVDIDSKQPTSEIAALRAAVRPLVRLYADLPATEFGPLALQSLRAAMISGSWLSASEHCAYKKANRPIGLARSTVNKYVNRIKLIVKWATSMELIPISAYQGLVTVAGLRRGRTSARDAEPVRPVAPVVVTDTLPHLPPVVRDMVQILLLTGMRCGELCVMRPSTWKWAMMSGFIDQNGIRAYGVARIESSPSAQRLKQFFAGT